jgi:GT2 family glycosyltransferase
MAAGVPLTDLSIVIVSYNVKHFTEQCLRSIQSSCKNLRIEVFVVDNASSDGSVEYLIPRFPSVTFIANQENLGFAKANNLALSKAVGRHLMILNPDTLVSEGALETLVAYLDSNPDVGAVGPKLLTRYGQFDRTSKRGFPSPWVSFCRLSGLAVLFPKSRLFGRYDLLYLDENQVSSIDALCGGAMILRRESYEKIGGLDETFFMFGEDIDWCYRIKLAGYQIHYVPTARIIHFKGESTRRSKIDRESVFYGAMHLFVEKHYRGRYPFFTHKILDLGILVAELLARLSKLYSRFIWPLIDLSVIYAALLLGRWLRFDTIGFGPVVFAALFFQSVISVASLAAVGVYGRRRSEGYALALGIGLAFLISNSFTYFFKQFAYSRLVNLFALVVGGSMLFAWRMLLHSFQRTESYRKFYQRRTMIVGTGKTARSVLAQLKQNRDTPYRIIGVIDPGSEFIGSMIEGAPVLGSEEEIERLIESEEVEEVLFAYDELDYNRILRQVARFGQKKVGFKVINTDSGEPSEDANPFLSVEYLSPRGLGRSIRRLTTLVLGR